jgi:hypothetical protein
MHRIHVSASHILAAGLVAAGCGTSGLVVTEGDLLARAWDELGDGRGTVVFELPEGTIDVDVALSSELVPDEHVDEYTLVLRGATSHATVSVVLTPTSVFVGMSDTRAATFYRVDEPALGMPFRQSTGDLQLEAATAGELAAREGATIDPSLADMPVLHVGPPNSGSIATSKYVYKNSSAREPINALTYRRGWSTSSRLNEAGLGYDCGSDSTAWLYDARHGGVDGEQKPNRHHASGGWDHCWLLRERIHAKIYNSKTGDTHGGGAYAAIAIHRDNTTHLSVNVQAGQDYLLAKWRSNGAIGAITHHWTSPGSCSHCGSWSGWVDVYEVKW